MRFFYNNLFDSVTLGNVTAGWVSSEEEQFPVHNLQHIQKGRVWKTTGDAGIADEFVSLNLGAATAVTAVIVLNHNILAADTGEAIQGHTSNSWGAPSFTSSVTPSTDPVAKIFGSETYQYWRLVWTKNVATTVYTLGRIFLGTYHDTERAPDYAGLVSSRRARDLVRESMGGQIYTIPRTTPRRWQITFSALTETQFESFNTIFDTVGTHKPFFFQIDPTGSGEVAEYLYGRFADVPPFAVSGFDSELRRDATLEIEEVI